MIEMYKGIANSPETELSEGISAQATIIKVNNINAFPEGPNLATIGTDENAETIKYAAKTANALSGCQRGIESTARAWQTGEKIARNFTQKDHADLIENVNELNESKLGKNDKAADSDKLDGQDSSYFATATAVRTAQETANHGVNAATAAQTAATQGVNAAAAAHGRANEAFTRAEQAFTSASEGKTKVANTLTGMGTPTSTTATWDTIVDNLKQHKYKSGQALDNYTADILTPHTLSKTQINPKPTKSSMYGNNYAIYNNSLYIFKKGTYNIDISRLNLISGVFEPSINANAFQTIGNTAKINQIFNDGLFVNDKKDYDNISRQYFPAVNKLDWNFNVLQRKTIIDILGADNFRNFVHTDFFVLKDKIYLLSWHKTNKTVRVTILNSNDLTTMVFFKEIPFLSGYGVNGELDIIGTEPCYSVKHNLIVWIAIGQDTNTDAKLVVTDDLLNLRCQTSIGNKNDSNACRRVGMSDDCVFMQNGKVYSILSGQLLYNEWRLADKSIWNRNGIAGILQIRHCYDVATYHHNNIYNGSEWHRTVSMLSFVGDHIELWDELFHGGDTSDISVIGVCSNGECIVINQDSYYALSFAKVRKRMQIILK